MSAVLLVQDGQGRRVLRLVFRQPLPVAYIGRALHAAPLNPGDRALLIVDERVICGRDG